MIDMETCEDDNSAKTTKRLEEFQVTQLPHPPYSPDISPCDFCLFDRSENETRGPPFQASDDVRTVLSDLWGKLGSNTLISVYHESIAKLEQMMAMNAESYSK
jgi:histone-lysine N-methyltransferase SETMAR